MIVILEGPDGAGKTTLANELVKRYSDAESSALYLHSRHHKNQWLYDVALARRAITAHSCGRTVIVDRCWIGDNIYGRIYRNGGGTWVRQLDALFRRYGAVYVFCLPARETVIAAHKAKHAAGLEKFATVDKIYDAYYDLWNGGGLLTYMKEGMSYVEQLSAYGGWKYRDDGVLYNWQKHKVNDLIWQIARARDRNSLSEAVSAEFKNFRGGIRRWHNMFLFVIADNETASAMPYPQFGPDWFPFTNAVHATGMPETHLCYTSSVNLRARTHMADTSHVPRMIHSLMPDCKVVPIGLAAKHDCDWLRIPVWRTLPYPFIDSAARLRQYSLLLREVFGG